MTLLAILLSDGGVGDYWDDVDQYVRNQLIDVVDGVLQTVCVVKLATGVVTALVQAATTRQKYVTPGSSAGSASEF